MPDQNVLGKSAHRSEVEVWLRRLQQPNHVASGMTWGKQPRTASLTCKIHLNKGTGILGEAAGMDCAVRPCTQRTPHFTWHPLVGWGSRSGDTKALGRQSSGLHLKYCNMYMYICTYVRMCVRIYVCVSIYSCLHLKLLCVFISVGLYNCSGDNC